MNAQTNRANTWHLLSVDAVITAFESSAEQDLSAVQAAERLKLHGSNEIQQERRRGSARMLADQFTDFMILLLVAAAVTSGLIGDVTDTVAILTIVALNAITGFVQEYRAERAVAALKLLAAPNARVLRAGRQWYLPFSPLVKWDTRSR